ncbi:MAG: hypothetical protein J6Y37_06765 [Paludibacteraceae bacterium]|nr:hypothetical protein [Paludibacteraceae bacterium]
MKRVLGYVFAACLLCPFYSCQESVVDATGGDVKPKREDFFNICRNWLDRNTGNTIGQSYIVSYGVYVDTDSLVVGELIYRDHTGKHWSLCIIANDGYDTYIDILDENEIDGFAYDYVSSTEGESVEPNYVFMSHAVKCGFLVNEGEWHYLVRKTLDNYKQEKSLRDS